jgi:hypothetical protein
VYFPLEIAYKLELRIFLRYGLGTQRKTRVAPLQVGSQTPSPFTKIHIFQVNGTAAAANGTAAAANSTAAVDVAANSTAAANTTTSAAKGKKGKVSCPGNYYKKVLIRNREALQLLQRGKEK